MSTMLVRNEAHLSRMPMTMPQADAALPSDIERRFSRPAKAPEKVTYELTRDIGYLFQYYRLREEMFISVWGAEPANGVADSDDAGSDIMIARIGNHVVGGCRLTFSSPQNRRALPMENTQFSLAQTLPQLDLEAQTYVEISRMAMLPEFQNSLVMLELSRQVLKRAAEKQARYAFSVSSASLARDYRKAAMLFGLRWNILGNVEIPSRDEDEGIRLVMSSVDLAAIHSQKPVAEASAEHLLAAYNA